MYACRLSQKWLHTNCTKQISGFKTCVHALFTAFNQLSKHARWCQCLYVSDPSGYITIVWSIPVFSRLMQMLLLMLPIQCQSISGGINVYMWRLKTVVWSIPIKTKPMWMLSLKLQHHYQSISIGVCVHVWILAMVTNRLYDTNRCPQCRHEECS